MKLSNLIAKGEKVDVYNCDGMAIKVFKDTHAKTKALREALTHARVEELGFTMPHINEVTVVDGQWAIAMELIEGKTLHDLMEEHPDKVGEYIEQMVDLQMTIHSVQVPGFHKFRDRLRRQINELASVDDVIKYELLSRLDSVPKHIKLCHGSFEPRNIVIKEGKPYILDWVAATKGNASADVATTYLLLALESKANAELYLELFCKKSKTKKKYVQEWLPIVAAARLTIAKPEEKELLMSWINVMDWQ